MNTCACISYSVYSDAHMRPIRIFCERKAHKFYAGDNFWNITGRQEMSPVAMFHNVLGRGFVIQQVILIFHQTILRPLG